MSRGVPFEPGNQLGKGRPKGSRNKSTSIVRHVLEEHSRPLIQKLIALGLKGGTRELLWCLNQLLLQAESPKLKLPTMNTADGINRAADIVMQAFATAKLSEARSVALYSMLSKRAEMLELHEVALKMQELEQRVKSGETVKRAA